MSSNNFNTSLFELDALSHFESLSYSDFVSDLPVADYESYKYDASLSTILESTFSEVEESEVQGVDESVSFDLAQYLASVPAVDRLLDTSIPLEVLITPASSDDSMIKNVVFDFPDSVLDDAAFDSQHDSFVQELQGNIKPQPANRIFDMYSASLASEAGSIGDSSFSSTAAEHDFSAEISFSTPAEPPVSTKSHFTDRFTAIANMYSVVPEADCSGDDVSFSSTAADHDLSADISFSTPAEPPVSTKSHFTDRFTAIANMYSVVPEADCSGDDVSFSSTAADHDLSADISFATLAESCSSTKHSASNDISISSIVADHDLSTDTPLSTHAETSFFPDTPLVVSEKVPISLVTEILNSSKDCKVTKVETLSRTFVILEVVH